MILKLNLNVFPIFNIYDLGFGLYRQRLFRLKVESVSNYMRYRGISPETQEAVMAYYRYIWNTRRGLDEAKVSVLDCIFDGISSFVFLRLYFIRSSIMYVWVCELMLGRIRIVLRSFYFNLFSLFFSYPVLSSTVRY